MDRFSKIGIVSLAALIALAACSKGTQSSSTTSTTTTAESAASASPGAESSPMAAASVASNGVSASNGKGVYQTNCSSCHQATGQGVPGTFPPLAGNPVVTGAATPVIDIVKNGHSGKITVKGTTYNGMMPAWGSQLSNSDIASVITYIRSSWGNSASAVTEAQVAAVKK